MDPCGSVRDVAPMNRLMTSGTSAAVEIRSTAVKVVAIDDRAAVRDVGVVVIDDSTVVVPIVSPMMPAPAEAGKESNAET